MILFTGLRSAAVPLVGNVTCRRLVEHFGSPAKALSASFDELSCVKGVNSSAALSIISHDGRKAAELAVAALARSGARLVTLLDEEYPPLLKEISDPPPYLYLKGKLPNPLHVNCCCRFPACI